MDVVVAVVFIIVPGLRSFACPPARLVFVFSAKNSLMYNAQLLPNNLDLPPPPGIRT